ncbi:MAG: DUF1013 domain-containing protein [Pseudomonadota bacterium]|nr:DUF1013 domain-containing protein [Pseudomonadota bacterium]
MAQPLMPKATAVWLLDNTSLSFDQIAEFCGLHRLEVGAIADGDSAIGMIGLDPVRNGQLTLEDIARCEKDPDARLVLAATDVPEAAARKKKGPRYTPVTKRAERPDGIAWLLKNHPELSDRQLCDLLGTTRDTIKNIRDRTHWNISNINPRNPVLLGLITQKALDDAIAAAGGSATATGDSTPATDEE